MKQAIEHFKNAVNLDGDLKVAKMYLATAYAQQYVPGVDTRKTCAMHSRPSMNIRMCCKATRRT